jgi:hypothetical protein
VQAAERCCKRAVVKVERVCWDWAGRGLLNLPFVTASHRNPCQHPPAPARIGDSSPAFLPAATKLCIMLPKAEDDLQSDPAIYASPTLSQTIPVSMQHLVQLGGP